MAMSPRLLRPRASGFNPKSIAGLYLWLDAADSATVTLNSGNVSQWRDKSGGNRHFSQASASRQPAYTIGGRAGKNCQTWTGSQLMSSDVASSNWEFLHDGTAPYSWFGVFGSEAGSTTIRTCLATGNSGRNVRSFYFWHDHRAGNNNRILYTVTQGDAANAVADRKVDNLTAGVVRVTRLHADLSQAAGSRLDLVVNTTVGVQNANWTASPAAGSPDFNLTIGSIESAVASFGFAGVMCEWLLYKRATPLSQSERIAIASYLSSKWGT